MSGANGGGTGGSSAGGVLVSAVSADYAAPYVAALTAAGVPGEAIRVVTPEDLPGSGIGAQSAGGAAGGAQRLGGVAGAGGGEAAGGARGADGATGGAPGSSGADGAGGGATGADGVAGAGGGDRPAGGAIASEGTGAARGAGGAAAGNGDLSALSTLATLAAGAAGLVLCGGVDVEPWRYGEEPLPEAGLEVLPALDALDWELLAGARAGRTPVWGICRGFQVINVFLGGSLWQDLPLQRPAAAAHDCGPPDDLLAHAARPLAADAPLGARLAAVTGGSGGMPRVNSRHHQAVKRLAPGLLAVADSPDDGLIEAAVLVADPAGTAEPAGTATPLAPGAPMDPLAPSAPSAPLALPATAPRTSPAPIAALAALASPAPLPAVDIAPAAPRAWPAAGAAAGAPGGGADWWVRGVQWHPEDLLALPEQMELWRDFVTALALPAPSAGRPSAALAGAPGLVDGATAAAR